MADDVLFNIGGDSTNILTSLQDILDSLDNVANGINDLVSEFSNLDAASSVFTDLDGLINDVDLTLLDFTTNVGTLATVLDTLNTNLNAVNANLPQLNSNTTTAVDVTTAFADAMTTTEDSLTAIADLTDNVDTSLSAMSTQLSDVVDALVSNTTAVADNAVAYDTLSQAMTTAAGMYTNVAAAANGTTGAQTAGTAATQEQTAAADENAAANAGAGDGMNNSSMAALMLAPMLMKAAGSFISMGTGAEDAMAHVTGLADPTLALAQNSGKLHDIMSQLSTQATTYGVNMKDAANGLYYVISAGYNSADAMTVLHQSMEAAAATGTQMDTVSNALTSVLHAYTLKASDASTVTNQMIEAVVQGKQGFDEFATTIGRTAAAGAQAGISFDQVAAAEATMTQINPSVQHDTQNLTHLFIKLSTGTDQMAKAAQGLGEKFNKTAFSSMDLMQKLQYVETATKGNATAMKTVLGDATSYGVAFDLLSNKGQNYANILDAIQHSNTALSDAFKTSSDTITFAMQRVQSVLSVLSMQLVTIISPYVSAMFQSLADMFATLANNSAMLQPLLGAIAGIMVGVLLAAGIALIDMFGGVILSMLTLGLVFGGLGAAIVAALPFLQNFMDTSGSVSVIMSIMSSTVAGAIAQFQQTFQAFAQVVLPIISSIAQSFIAQLIPAVLSLVNKGLGAAQTFAAGLESAIYAAQPALQGLATLFNTVITPAIIGFMNGIGGQLIGAVQGMGQALQSAAPQIQAFGTYFQNTVVPQLQKFGPLIVTAATQLGKFTPAIALAVGGLLLWGPASAAFTTATAGLPALIEGASSALGALGTAAQVGAGWMSALGGGLKAFGSAIAHPIQTARMLGGVFQELWLSCQELAMTVGEALVGAFGFVSDAFGAFAGMMAAGMSPIEIIGIGLWDMAAAAWAAVAPLLAVAAPFIALALAVAAVSAGLYLFFTRTSQGQQMLQLIVTEAKALWNVLVAAMQPALQQVGAELKRLQPVWAQMGQLWQTIQPFVMALGAVLGTLLVAAIGILIGSLVGIITVLGRVLQGVVMFISGVVQAFTGLVQVIGGIIAVIIDIISGPKGWGKLPGDLTTIKNGLLNIWNGLWHAVEGVVTASIGAILSGVSAFGGTVIGFFQKIWSVVVGHSIWPDMWKGVVDHTTTQTKVTQDKTAQFSDNIVSSFNGINVKSTAQYTAFWKNIQSVTTTSMNNTVNAVTGGMARMQAAILSGMSSIVTNMNQQWAALVQATTQQMAALLAVVEKTFKSMQQFIQTAMQAIANTSTQAWTSMTGAIQGAQNVLSTFIGKSWNDIWQIVKAVCLAVFATAIAAFYGLVGTLPAAMVIIEKIVDANWKLMWNMTGMAMQGMADDAKDGMKKLSDTMKDGAKDVVDQIEAMIKTITKDMDDLAKSAEDWGKHFDEGFAKGIESGQGTVGAAIDKLIQQITSKMQFTTPKSGPLATYNTWMPHMVTGMAKSLTSSSHVLSTAAAVTAQKLADAVKLKAEKAAAAAAKATLDAQLKAEKAAAAAAKKAEAAAVQQAKTASAAAAAATSRATTASNNVGTASTSGMNSDTEVINLLQEILSAIEALQGNGGSIGSGSSSIGYPIPSTQLGSLTQQFGSSGRLTPNDIAGLYQQLNQLGGLSTEYASRGASSGVGF